MEDAAGRAATAIWAASGARVRMDSRLRKQLKSMGRRA